MPPYSDAAYADASSTIQHYFPDASFDKYSSGALNIKDIKDYLEKQILYLDNGNVLDPIIIGRAFLFYTIGALLFPNGNSMIYVGWLAYLDDVNKVAEYDWGFAILACI